MKLNQLSWILLVSPLFFFTSCKPVEAHVDLDEVNMDSVKAQITLLEAGYASGSNAKDVDAVAKYYAADAESMAPFEETRVGMDAIKAGIKREMDADTLGNTVSFTTTGVWASGNLAVETGTINITKKSGEKSSTGKYMTLFELRDGKYVAIRDIWNTNKPEGKTE